MMARKLTTYLSFNGQVEHGNDGAIICAMKRIQESRTMKTLAAISKSMQISSNSDNGYFRSFVELRVVSIVLMDSALGLLKSCFK